LNSSQPLRNVLVIEDEPSMRNVLYVLLAGLGCEGEVASDGRQALAKIGKTNFCAVLLDLRCSNMPACEMVAAIRDISPTLVGKVLVITGEVADAATMDLIKQNCWPHIPRQRAMQELWQGLHSLVGLAPSRGQRTSRAEH
jgi:DNA-binding NtrC family response regulator